mgnify:CR=1 FL=1
MNGGPGVDGAARVYRLVGRTVYAESCGKLFLQGQETPALGVQVGQNALAKQARCKPAEVKPEVEALVRDGRVHLHPPVSGRSPLYGVGALDPARYLGKVKKEVDALCARLQPHGVAREDVLGAVRGLAATGATTPPSASAAVDLPSRIVEILRLSCDRGVLAISLLRALFNRRKEEFDAAVLDLHGRGLVLLHRHDGPQALPAEERYELVDDGQGTFYVGIGLR